MSQEKRNMDAKSEAGAVIYDEKKKLSELQMIILNKASEEQAQILEEARLERDRWVAEQTAQLDAMCENIKNDAAKRAQEITTRHLLEAEGDRDKNRLRLQSSLVFKALTLLHDSMLAFSKRADYEAILAGWALEVCARFPNARKLRMRLRAEDALYGESIVEFLKKRLPELDIAFDNTPAEVLGGVVIFSEEEKWRVVADWKTKIEEITDTVAKAVLAEL